METKICCTCKNEKELEEFHRHKNGKLGRAARCKSCSKINQNVRKEKKKEYDKKYRIKNKDKIDNRIKNYTIKNKKKISIRKLEWSRKNKNRINENIRKRKNSEPIFKLKVLFRTKLNKILKVKKNKTFEIIGCSPNELKIHLESQFKNGMTWQNHGHYGWHIDHIIPLSTGKTYNELIKLSHYTNLQPLWWYENLEKRFM